MKKYQMFVGGKPVDAADGRTEQIIEPSTEQVLGEVPLGGAEDVDRAVKAAAQAFDSWSTTLPKDRMRMLLALADVIDQNAAELAELEARNVGKPIGLAEWEMGFNSDNLRFFAG